MSRETFQKKLRQTKLDKGTIFPVSLEPHVDKIGTKTCRTLNTRE